MWTRSTCSSYDAESLSLSLARPAASTRRGGYQWLLWPAVVEESDFDGGARFLRRFLCHGGLAGWGLFVGIRSLLLRSRTLDPLWQFSSRLQFLSRSVVARHAAR